MTSRGNASALIAALGLAVAACAGGAADGPPSPSAQPIGRSGDELLRAGDYDGAVRAFERENVESPVAQEKLLNAKTRAASSHAMAAMRAAGNGDLQRAQDELARADGLAPDLPLVRSAHETVDARLGNARRAASLREEGTALLSSNPDEADRLLAEAQSMSPETSDSAMQIAKLRREATLRGEADRSADRAAAAWDAGDRDRTVRELAGARYGNATVARAEALRRRIEEALVAEKGDETSMRASLAFAADAGLHPSVIRTLRDRLVDRLLASARDLAETRRPATAALLEIEAKRLRGDVKTPALDGVRDAVTVTILVRPFDDATGGSVDGARLARAVRERLTLDALGGGMPTRALDDSADVRAASPNALVLTGSILTARATEGRLGREDQRIRYQAGTTRSPNPDFDALVTKIDAAGADVRKADDEKTNAAAWLSRLEGLGFTRGDGTPRIGDVEFQTKIAAAKARVDRADAELKRARDAEFALRQTASTTPRDLEIPIYKEQLVTVTTSSKTSQITARLDLASQGASIFSQDVTAAAVHKETVSDGFAPAGLAPDPDDTPDDAEMAVRAADRFAAIAAGRVRSAAESAARRHLVAARAAEGAGRRDEAAESYALYLLSTPDVASPERADAARSLAELLGVHVALRTGPRKEEQ